MTNSISGGSSFSQSFHQSRFNSAPSSLVGSCMYCAVQYWGCMPAFLARSCSTGHCPGHRLLPDGSMAGNLISCHGSAVGLCSAHASARPMGSFFPQRVPIITIRPPGIKRCIGPTCMYVHAVSKAASGFANTACSDTKSSAISK